MSLMLGGYTDSFLRVDDRPPTGTKRLGAGMIGDCTSRTPATSRPDFQPTLHYPKSEYWSKKVVGKARYDQDSCLLLSVEVISKTKVTERNRDVLTRMAKHDRPQ